MPRPELPLVDVSSLHLPEQAVDLHQKNGLIQVQKLAGEIFETHPALATYLNCLGDTDDTRKKVVGAAVDHNFPGTTTEEEYKKLYIASYIREKISRQLILDSIEKGATFGLKPYEIGVLKASCKIADVYDELCWLWINEVKYGEANKNADVGTLSNRYTVVRQDSQGQYMQVPLAEAYSDQVTVICDHWRQVTQELLDDGNPEAAGLANYFKCYADALACRDLSRVNDLWLDVDRAWMTGVKGSLQPGSAREFSYFDKRGVRIFPDFKLAIALDENRDVIEKTKAAMQKYLLERFAEHSSLEASRAGLSMVQPVEIFDVVFAGSYELQPAGQSLPNEEAVRQELGTRVWLNKQVVVARWALAKGLLAKTFKYDGALFNRVDLNRDAIAMALAGHEFGEPLFITDEIRQTYGEDVERLLNEDLGDLCITGILRAMRDGGDLGERALAQEILENHILFQLGVYHRLIDTARGSDTKRPYYQGEALTGLHRMLRSGVIGKDEKGEWKVNLDSEKVEKFYELAEHDLRTQVTMADFRSRDCALQYLLIGTETESIAELIRILKPDAVLPVVFPDNIIESARKGLNELVRKLYA